MTLPRVHSCTWSDDAQGKGKQPAAQGSVAVGPESLKDKELYLSVTYPDTNSRGKSGDQKNKRRRNTRKLWAVVIIEAVRRAGTFSYEVALRRIFKTGDRFIRVSITNDPGDQSDDAGVFSILSPSLRQLTPLEQHLTWLAAQRVYHAITEIWPSRDTGDAGTLAYDLRRPEAEIALPSELAHIG